MSEGRVLEHHHSKCRRVRDINKRDDYERAREARVTHTKGKPQTNIADSTDARTLNKILANQI